MAKHGNPDAIEALINRSVQAKGIRITASRVSDSLTLLAESDDHSPDRDFLIEVVRKGFDNLNSHTIRRVFLRGYLSGQPQPLWRETLLFDVDPKPPQPTMAPSTRQLPRTNASPTLNLVGSLSQFLDNHPSFIATILLAGVCLGALGQWLAPRSMVTAKWDYHFEVIEVRNDQTQILKAVLTDLGSNGWELSHMKQSNIKDREGKLVTYEGIFKRPSRSAP